MHVLGANFSLRLSAVKPVSGIKNFWYRNAALIVVDEDYWPTIPNDFLRLDHVRYTVAIN